MERTSIFNDIKSLYIDCLDPAILEVNILNANKTVYFEIVKSAGGNDLIVYKYALKDWDIGHTFTAEEAGIKDPDDLGIPKDEFAHFGFPLFDAGNDIEVNTSQFIDTFLMERETLMNMTDLFIS